MAWGVGMADVFVSYKTEDRRRVAQLVHALEQEGLSCWWDAEIGGGDTWRERIEQQLEAARCVIVVWSKRSVSQDGRFIRDEASRAQRRGTYLPVLIDKVEPPLGFGETQALPLTRWRGNRNDPRYEAVRRSVRLVMGGGGAQAQHSSVPPGEVDRRAMLVWGGAFAGVGALGVGGWEFLRNASPGARSDSIAVLPFANLSGDPSQSYFSDGIAEELRSALSRIDGLKVVGRTSSEAVRNEDAVAAAKRLHVGNILTGSLRKSISTVRVSAELVDGRTGIERWSQDYDRAPGDAIKIQIDIAENVANALSAALGIVARAAITTGATSNPDALKLVLQADQLSSKVSEDTLQQAIDLLDAAIALDPNYADAYARKALLLANLANGYGHNSDEVARGRDKAAVAARKAISLAPNLPYGHLALAYLYRTSLQLRAAMSESEKAAALAPNDARVLRNLATFLSRTGQSGRALPLADKVIALDPLAQASWDLRSSSLYLARRYGDALASARQVPAGVTVSPAIIGDCQMMLGNAQQARAAYARVPQNDPTRVVGEAVLAARTGARADALAMLQQTEKLFADAASYQLAEIRAQLGQPDEAFAALQQAWKVKDGGLIRLKVDPWIDPLRADSRFDRLARMIDFPA